MKTRGERKGGGHYETIINIWDLLKYSQLLSGREQLIHINA